MSAPVHETAVQELLDEFLASYPGAISIPMDKFVELMIDHEPQLLADQISRLCEAVFPRICQDSISNADYYNLRYAASMLSTATVLVMLEYFSDAYQGVFAGQGELLRYAISNPDLIRAICEAKIRTADYGCIVANQRCYVIGLHIEGFIHHTLLGADLAISCPPQFSGEETQDSLRSVLNAFVSRHKSARSAHPAC